jgi:hypothetical protein
VSGAYVLPAVLGPVATGLIVRWFSWRAVFLALLPVLAVVVLLILPAVARFGATGQPAADTRRAVFTAGMLAVGVAAASVGFDRAGGGWGLALCALGLAAVWLTLRRVMPPGLFTARPVRPAALAARGLLGAAFIGVETFAVYTLTVQFGLSVTRVGFAVSLSALTWAGASWAQSRWDERDGGAGRGLRLLAGTAAFLAAESLMLAVPWQRSAGQAFALAVTGHTLAGLGMGLAEPTTGVLALSDTPDGESGSTASSMQLTDLVVPALGIGLGGALVAAARQQLRSGATAALAVQLALAALAVGCAWRLHRASAHPDPAPHTPRRALRES